MTEHDEIVEKVARAIADTEVADPKFSRFDRDGEDARDKWRRKARAAIAAMAPINEMWIGDYMLRLAPNGVWIGRPGGEGGEFATEHVECVIAQFYREQF